MLRLQLTSVVVAGLALGVGLIYFAFALPPARTGAGEAKAAANAGSIGRKPFGKTKDGKTVTLFTITNKNGCIAKVMDYGALLTELHMPDKDGKLADVVLGFDNLQQYLDGHPYFGATVGRVANRIAKGKFKIKDKEYTLATNNGPNHLHGGVVGFDKVIWDAATSIDGNTVRFRHISKDGEEGYPGTVTAWVSYTLTDDNELRLDYEATTDQTTPVNLTHHSYFNLSGGAARPILDHELTIAADSYTPVDDTLIPTGEIKPVAGTPLDFTKPTAVGKRIDQLKGDPGGYDHNFVLRGRMGELRSAAVLRDPVSGRTLEILTTEPGLQFYSGNFLDGKLKGKGGVTYLKHQGLCLEAQHFPDSVNQPSFPTVLLEPGQTYKQTTVHRFTAK